MKNLIIIGARGFGREVYNIAKESKGYNSEFVIKGFLDDKKDVLDDYIGYPSILNSVENYEVRENDVFICALGDVNYKKYYSDLILSKGGEFISIVHSTAYISPMSKIGKGCIVSRFVSVSCDVTIGDFVTLSTHSGIGHDTKIGNYCHIGGYTNISGFVKIEDNVIIHPQCNITPHKKIHNNAIVGTSSVVVGNVKSGITVYGNPAKKIEF